MPTVRTRMPSLAASAFTPLVALPSEEVPLLRLKRLLHDEAHCPTHQLAQGSLAVLGVLHVSKVGWAGGNSAISETGQSEAISVFPNFR